MGLTTLPSVKLRTLTSGPVRNSSTTTWLPEAPELFVQHDLVDALGGLLFVLADEHALAQRKAVGLDDYGVFALSLDILHDLGGVVVLHTLRWGCRTSS